MPAFTTENPALRWCADIGMEAIDRAPCSCKHATEFCRVNCYNLALYIRYGNMRPRDVRNEAFWNGPMSGAGIRRAFARKTKHQTKRARIMTRGEAFSSLADVRKVEDLLGENPGTIWWIPTRSWRHPVLRAFVRALAVKYTNCRIMASIDPTTTKVELDGLVADGWSTMFFGNDDACPAVGAHKCAKTWKHAKGHCATCKAGCFKADRVDVWLKWH